MTLSAAHGPPPAILALDVGGANLKAADGLGFVASHEFPLWREPARLTHAIARLIEAAPRADHIAATMTGELADCFVTKREGVAAIVAALAEAAAGRGLSIYLTDGTFASPQAAIERPLAAAAANWHALARFAARFVTSGAGLLVDIGSTTTDIIPIVDGGPAASGATDPERLAAGELVYTGVVRSPVCAVATTLPWRGRQCPTAHELFAMTLDAYVTLGDLPEDATLTGTADGRPATRECARDRLARSICADREMFSDADALAAATAIRTSQAAKIAIALRNVVGRMKPAPATIVLSGQGEFLARHVMDRMRLAANVVSLSAELGPGVSRCATAHALAVVCRETTTT
ncbi:MAG: H4MPT-linked C1 transfer pathway protein [Planctomycetia bacterium]|nr:H4MPT-linked C1 transfer pathway protein [Planctomycetia bacterium]